MAKAKSKDVGPKEPVAEPQEKQPPERKKYASFYEAWPNVTELRELTTQQGAPRLGLTGDKLIRARQLIVEYQNG